MSKKYSTVKWSIWWLLTFSFILVLFFRISTAVITDNLSKELGFTQLQISNIASLALYSYAIMQIPAGILIDKYGARKISSIGMIIGGMGSILFGHLPLEKSVCRSGSNSENWTWNNRLVPNRKRSTSRLYIVTLFV